MRFIPVATLLLLLLLIPGCAAVNLLQFEDAETLPPMEARGGGFVGVGPNFYNLYHDSSRTPGAIALMVGAAGKIGVLEWVDAGGSVWTSSVPPFGLLIGGLLDLGGRFDLKLMLTPRQWRQRLALTGSVGGYWNASTTIAYGDAGHGATWNAGAGVIYSYMFSGESTGRSASAYLSLRADRFSSSYIYDTGDSLRRSNNESIYVDGVDNGYTVAVGLRATGRDVSTTGAAIELAGTFMRNRWTGDLDWILFGGIAFSFQ
jgi:hypothetical protein